MTSRSPLRQGPDGLPQGEIRSIIASSGSPLLQTSSNEKPSSPVCF